MTVYLPHPYAPYERGTNENTNGLVREYFPKRIDLDVVAVSTITEWQNKLNQRPRKSLNYLTFYKLFHDAMLHLI